MADEESDNKSVESGSCTCSNYNEDCSWFYDSRNLATSFMRFCILNDEDKIIIKKEKSRNTINDKNSNRINKYNELKKDLFPNSTNKRKNIIKITNNSSSGKKNDAINDDKIDKGKLNDNNLIKYCVTKQKDNDSFELTESIDNRSFTKLSNLSNYFNNGTYSEMKMDSKIPNFFSDNMNEYEHNYSAPIDTTYFHEKNINLHRSPINYFNKRKKIFNINNKTEEKNKIFEPDESKGYNRPRRSAYNSSKNTNDFIDNIKEKELYKANIINNNYQTKGRTIKEKIVKETKTITLQPGQTIKPKMLTKRKLKPNTIIVKNPDGSQNIITENTILTKITVNEMVDSSELYDDKYPIDIQLVKQYITKIYKTEIENNPYKP